MTEQEKKIEQIKKIDARFIAKLLAAQKQRGINILTPADTRRFWKIPYPSYISADRIKFMRGIEYDTINPSIEVIQGPRRKFVRFVVNYTASEDTNTRMVSDLLELGYKLVHLKPIPIPEFLDIVVFNKLRYNNNLLSIVDGEKPNAIIEDSIKDYTSSKTFDTFKDFYND
jgi:hypothetical protein